MTAGLETFLELFKYVLPGLPVQLSNGASFWHWAGRLREGLWSTGREMCSTENQAEVQSEKLWRGDRQVGKSGIRRLRIDTKVWQYSIHG